MRVLGWILLVLFVGAGSAAWFGGQAIDRLGGPAHAFTSVAHEVDGPSRAIVLTMGSISFGGNAWLMHHAGEVDLRLHVAPVPGARRRPFLGYARTHDVATYLAGSGFDVVRNVQLSPWELQLQSVPALAGRPGGGELPPGVRSVPGISALLQPSSAADPSSYARARVRLLPVGAALPLPAAQSFWVARADGGGTLRVPVREGAWSVVLLSPTGGVGVHAMVSVAARVPLIGRFAHGLRRLGGGLLLAALVIFALLTVPKLLRGRSLPPTLPPSGGSSQRPNSVHLTARPSAPAATRPAQPPPTGPIDFHA